MQGHRTLRAKRVVADPMGEKSEALKSELGSVKVQELDELGYFDSACGIRIFRVVSTDQGVGVSAIFRRWSKRRAAAETVFSCSRSVA